MAEVRCPMCGKPNPPGLDVCQYCQARLTPLHVPPSEADSETTSQPSGSETPGDEGAVPEWLRSLRLEEETTDLEEQQEEEEFPDWLQGSDDESLPDQPAEEGGELPDWLSDLRQQGEGPIEEAHTQELEADEAELSEEAPDAGMPDWLADIRLLAPGGGGKSSFHVCPRYACECNACNTSSRSLSQSKAPCHGTCESGPVQAYRYALRADPHSGTADRTSPAD